MNDSSENEAHMEPAEVVEAFFDALNISGPEVAADYLTEDYTTESPPFPKRSKEQWLGSQKMFLRAFPDMHEAFEVQRVDGNAFRGINRTTGTHTGDFDLSAMGIGIVPATGRSAETVFSVTHVVKDGKIVSTEGTPVDNMGLEAVLAQLGIEVPKYHFYIDQAPPMRCSPVT